MQLTLFAVISVVAFDGKIFVELIQILDERKKKKTKKINAKTIDCRPTALF